MKNLLEEIYNQRDTVFEWLKDEERTGELPLYSSVDIRDAGFKTAVVDTNLFPAGFNNLCPHGIDDSVHVLGEEILKRVPHCQNVLIIAEEHTRNTWYLENVRILENIIRESGFGVRTATFLDVRPAVCGGANFVELETAMGQELRVYSIERVLQDIRSRAFKPDLVIMNNDLSTGIPELLHNLSLPIYPSIKAGWHSRSKTHHFSHTQELLKDFSKLLGVDPWLLGCFDASVPSVDIHAETDREKLRDAASDLMIKIRTKYTEHGIDEKPFVFMKADSGTYGMGVMAFEDSSEIMALNRKKKNKLHKGKSSIVIDRFLLQEGVPSRHRLDNKVAEACIYQISNRFVGGFYRLHREKNSRQNLNAKGMDFSTMCPHSERFSDCGTAPEKNVFLVYRVLARIAGIAAHREIKHLETAAPQ